MWGKETEGYREHAQVPLYCITLSAAARLPFQVRRFGTMLYCATTGEAIIERGAAAAQTQKWTATVNIIYGGSLCGDVGLDKALSVLALCAHGRALRWSWGGLRTPSPAPSSAAVGGGPARAPWEKQGAPPPRPLAKPRRPRNASSEERRSSTGSKDAGRQRNGKDASAGAARACRVKFPCGKSPLYRPNLLPIAEGPSLSCGPHPFSTHSTRHGRTISRDDELKKSAPPPAEPTYPISL